MTINCCICQREFLSTDQVVFCDASQPHVYHLECFRQMARDVSLSRASDPTKTCSSCISKISLSRQQSEEFIRPFNSNTFGDENDEEFKDEEYDIQFSEPSPLDLKKYDSAGVRDSPAWNQRIPRTFIHHNRQRDDFVWTSKTALAAGPFDVLNYF